LGAARAGREVGALKLVLDSSAALRAAQSTSARRSIGRHELIAPPLLWSEVHSAVSEATWRKELDADAARLVLARFAELEVRRRQPVRLYAEAYSVAAELGWAKTYDAEFVALARLDGAFVLTTDARLRRGAERTGLVISPAELPAA
jgi:predicted nucleic acid-binding protein